MGAERLSRVTATSRLSRESPSPLSSSSVPRARYINKPLANLHAPYMT